MLHNRVMNSRQEHKLDGPKDTIIMSTESEDLSLTKKYHHQIAEKALGFVFFILTTTKLMYFKIGKIDVGDGCLRRNVLV